MHIGILFYSDTIALASQAISTNGRSIANNDFLKKIIRHKKEHQITLFVSSRLEKDFLKEFLGELHRDISIVSFIDMKDFFENSHLDILHTLGPDIYRGLHLRNAFKKDFAVTGVTHSLGHQPFLEWIYLTHHQKPQACDRLICTSPTAQRICQDLIQKVFSSDETSENLKTALIPLGLEVSSFDKGESIRNRLKISEDSVVFLILGRFSCFTKTDLIPLLFMISKIVKTSKKEVHFIFSGSTGGEEYHILLEEQSHKLKINSSIKIFPNPDEQTKRHLYKTADIFLAINDNPQETFGLSILEASASGLPVIASDWNGYRSLVQDAIDGYLIPTMALPSYPPADLIAPIQIDSLNHFYFSQGTATDMDVFYEKCMALIDNRIVRYEMGSAAQQKALQYDWTLVIQQYFQLWESLGKAALEENSYQVFNYHDAFKSYATRTASENEIFETNSQGLTTLETKEIFQYPLSDEVFKKDLLFKILFLLKTPQSLKNLSIDHEHSSQVHYHVLWLYKYGYLSLRQNFPDSVH